MSDESLSVWSGVAQGLEKAASNLVNVSMARQEHDKKMQLFDIQKKKGELDLKEQEALGADPEVLQARKAVFTLGAKQAKLGLEKDTLVLDEAQKKAKREMEDRQKEAEIHSQWMAGTLPAGMQVEQKIGDTTISNKKTGGMEDLFAGAMTGQAPITSPEERTQFVEGLPTGVKEVVQGLTNYDLDLSKVSSYRGNQRLQLAAAARIADPTFDMSQYPARAAFRKDFSSGKMGGNIRSFNTAIEHLSVLDNAIDKVPSNNMPAITAVQRGIAGKMAAKGKTAVGMTEERGALTAIAGELATIFKNTGGTDQEIDKWFQSYDPNASHEQKRQFIKTGTELMLGRLNALNNDYERVMGKPNDRPLISDDSQKAVERMAAKASGAEGPKEGFVRMTSPEGELMDIPEANVAKAKEMKFTEATSG